MDETTGATARAWATLREELTQRLDSLGNGEKFRLGEPAALGRPAGLLRQRRSEPRRYVQFIGGPELITAECVGSTNFGGDWAMSHSDEVALERLGWSWPLAGTSPHFRQHVRRIESVWLVDSAIGALQLLGADVDAVVFAETAQKAAHSAR